MKQYLSDLWFDNIGPMPKKRARREKRPIFESIRKPTAPSSQKFGDERPDERAHPALRKVKHKKKSDPDFSADDAY